MRRKYLIGIIVTVVGHCGAWAQTGESQCGQVIRAVATELTNRHVSQQHLDDRLGEKWGNEFMSRLDPRKMYFLRSDIQEFEQSYRRLGDFVHDGDVSFAKSVHQRFKTRLSTAFEFVTETLSEKHNFQADECFQLRFSDFANHERELKERWRLRIKFEILLERSNGSRPNDIVAFLRSRYAAIRDLHTTLGDEGLTHLFADSLATAFDGRSQYVPESELSLYRTGIIANYTIGLSLEQRVGEYVVAGTAREFAREVDFKTLRGWVLMAIRRTNGSVYHLTEMPRPNVSHLILSPTGRLGSDKEVILELYDPVTQHRVSRAWPRGRTATWPYGLRIQSDREPAAEGKEKVSGKAPVKTG